MRTISCWLLAFNLNETQAIEMPEGAEILCAQMPTFLDENAAAALSFEQRMAGPQIWALVSPTAQPSLREFVIYGTASAVPDSPGRYISTFQIGRLAFHVFESNPGPR